MSKLKPSDAPIYLDAYDTECGTPFVVASSGSYGNKEMHIARPYIPADRIVEVICAGIKRQLALRVAMASEGALTARRAEKYAEFNGIELMINELKRVALAGIHVEWKRSAGIEKDGN